MIEEKKSFVLYIDHLKHIKSLNREQRGDILTAILAKVTDESIPELDPVTAMLFSVISDQLDRDLKKWQDTKEKRKMAGKKGGTVSRKNKQDKQNKQMLNLLNKNKQNKQSQANQAVNVNGNVNVNVNGNVNDNVEKGVVGGESEKLPAFEETGFSIDVYQALENWLQYKAERRESYKPTGLKSLIADVRNEVDRIGERAVIAQIEKAMASGWKGMNLDKITESKKGGINSGKACIDNRFEGLSHTI